ncbi:MAG: enolase C-terminal domain-like protein [Ilumatobacter sp.]|nr:enolase C-terminal domain-like protein [Ilumatobacter sp.]
MARHLTYNRRRFLRETGGFAALAAAVGAPRTLLGTQATAVRIRAVDAYPIYINQRSEGLLDAPTFSGDDDPRRWRFGGPFEQLPSAVIAIIKTDQGITGFGMGAGGSVAVEIIDGHLKHLLMGANALNVEQLWDQMYTSAVLYGRRGVFAMALSAVDNALWDIVGKHAGQPVHELLGQVPPGPGRPPSASAHTFNRRNRIPIYQTGGDVAEGKARGVRHFKRSLPIGPHTSAEEMTRRIDSVLAAREAMGPDGNLMTDCVSRNGTVEWAVGLAERLRSANLYFMEELLSPDNVFGYAELVSRIGGGGPGWTKVACGEHEYTEHGFDVLIRLNSAEILQPDITWCGGTTAGRRIAALVETAGLEIIPHRGGSSWGFPIALTSPSCTMAESFPAGSTILDAMSCTVENGEVIAPTGAGFGTTLTEALVLDHRLTA